MHYTVDTASKFAFFADSDIEEADPDELILKAKKEKETEKIAKEKAKKEEKEKIKKAKVKDVQTPAAASQPQQTKVKEASKGTQNAQSNKPPRLNRPKTDEQTTANAVVTSQNEQESFSPRQSFEPTEVSSQNDRPFRGRGGFRGGRGRGSFPREDGVQTFSEGNVMGESGEFRRGGFRGRGGRRGTGAHPQERHSGSRVTGVKAVDKRNGAGAHNWGSEQDELDLIDSEKLQAGIVEVHSEAANVPGDINADENIPPTVNEDEGADDKAQTEEPLEESAATKDMTVEEYMAKSAGERERLQGLVNLNQKKTKKKVPVPAEGKDSSFKGMVAYIKKSTEEDEDSEDEDEEGEDYEENPKRKRTLEVPFRHNRNAPGGGRGFRGRGRGRGTGDFRGGRGRGSARGGHGRDENIQLQLDSTIDFPTL